MAYVTNARSTPPKNHLLQLRRWYSVQWGATLFMVSGLQQRGRGLFEYIRSMYYLRNRGNSMCHISWSHSRRSNRVPFWNLSLEVIEIPTETWGHCDVLVSFILEKNLRYPFERRLGESQGLSERDVQRNKTPTWNRFSVVQSVKSRYRLSYKSQMKADRCKQRSRLSAGCGHSVRGCQKADSYRSDGSAANICPANTKTVQHYYSWYPIYGLIRQL